MRLSLRTLLAFEDKVFDLEQQRQLERLIPQHKAATAILGRIRGVVRDPSLGVPGMVDRHEELDPNLVAAYLDHQMSPEYLEQFESFCLTEDKFLGELASVHHIVSNVLGEPARTNRECRFRCYELYRQVEAASPNAAPEAPPISGGFENVPSDEERQIISMRRSPMEHDASTTDETNPFPETVSSVKSEHASEPASSGSSGESPAGKKTEAKKDTKWFRIWMLTLLILLLFASGALWKKWNDKHGKADEDRKNASTFVPPADFFPSQNPTPSRSAFPLSTAEPVSTVGVVPPDPKSNFVSPETLTESEKSLARNLLPPAPKKSPNNETVVEVLTSRKPVPLPVSKTPSVAASGPHSAPAPTTVLPVAAVIPEKIEQTSASAQAGETNVEKEKAEREKAEKEKAEQERIAKEKEEKEKIEREKAEKEKAERERIEKEKAAKEKAAKIKAEREKAKREKEEQEKAEKEKTEREKVEKEKAEKEKAERERAEAEKKSLSDKEQPTPDAPQDTEIVSWFVVEPEPTVSQRLTDSAPPVADEEAGTKSPGKDSGDSTSPPTESAAESTTGPATEPSTVPLNSPFPSPQKISFSDPRPVESGTLTNVDVVKQDSVKREFVQSAPFAEKTTNPMRNPENVAFQPMLSQDSKIDFARPEPQTAVHSQTSVNRIEYQPIETPENRFDLPNPNTNPSPWTLANPPAPTPETVSTARLSRTSRSVSPPGKENASPEKPISETPKIIPVGQISEVDVSISSRFTPRAPGRVLPPSEPVVFFTAISSNTPWRMESQGFDLRTEQYLLTTAPFYADVELEDDIRIEMIGDSKFCVLPRDEKGIPGIYLDYGRLVIRLREDNSNDSSPKSLRIRTEKSEGVVGLSDSDSLVFVDTFAEILSSPPRGGLTTDSVAKPPETNTILGLLPGRSGTVSWASEKHDPPLVVHRETSVLFLNGKEEQGLIRNHPNWLRREALPEESRELATTCRRIFDESRENCEAALHTLIRDKSPAVRSFGYRLWGDLGRFDIPLSLLSQAENKEDPVRSVLVPYFREVMKRDEETVQRLADAIDAIRR